MDIKYKVFDDTESIHVAKDKIYWLASCDCDNEPSGSIKGGDILIL
jgi:hypothetical protein